MNPTLGIVGGYPLSQALVALTAGFAIVALIGKFETYLPNGNSVPTAEPATRFLQLLTGFTIVAVGFAGVASNAKPTGTRGFDVVWSAVFAVTVSFAATRVHRSVLLVSIVPAAVFVMVGTSWSFWGAAWCFAPLGGAVALQLLPPTSDTARLTTAGAICASLFYFPTNVTSRVPSLCAGIVATILLLGFLVSRRRRRRTATGGAGRWGRRRVGAYVVAGGLVVIGSMFVARELITTKSRLDKAVASLSGSLSPVESLDLDAAETALASAVVDLRAAQSSLGSLMWRFAPAIPVAAQNRIALDGLVDSASAVATTGEELIRTNQLDTLRRPDGSIDIRRLQEVLPTLDSLQGSLTTLTSEIRQAEGPWIAPALTRKATAFRPKVRKALSHVGTAKAAGENLPQLLGADRPRRYLLVFPTLSEARGSGGVIGNWGEVEIDNGAISLTRFDRILSLHEGGTPWEKRNGNFPPDYLVRYASFTPKRYFENLLVSPDFPTNARILAEQYPQAGGRDVDGVISIDPYGLAAFLALEGPLTVAGLDQEVTSENAAKLLLHDLYVQAGDSQEGRVVILEQIARLTFERMRSIPLGSPQRLVTSLGKAFGSRNIQMWSKDPQTQKYLQSLGVTGSYLGHGADTGDTLGLVTQNAGGNKIDWFVERSLDYRVTVDRKGKTRAVATAEVRNLAPSTGLPRYVIGNIVTTREVPLGTASTLFSLYSPLELDRASVFGEKVEVERSKEFGLNVYTLLLDIPANSRQEIVLELSGILPPAASDGLYTLQLLHQPGVHTDKVTVSVQTLDDNSVAPPQRQVTPAAPISQQEVLLDQNRTLSFATR